MKRTPLIRTTPLARGTSRLVRATPIKPVNQPRLDRRTRAYKQYLASDVWRTKRLQALIAAEWRCQRCGAREDDVGLARIGDVLLSRRLEVHHRKGALRFGGRELPEDLEVCCTLCHRAEHAGRFIRPRGLRGGRA